VSQSDKSARDGPQPSFVAVPGGHYTAVSLKALEVGIKAYLLAVAWERGLCGAEGD